MLDGAALLGAMIWSFHAKGQWGLAREANLLDGGAPFYGAYRCADGRFVALGAIEPQFWKTFLARCRITDPDLAEPPREPPAGRSCAPASPPCSRHGHATNGAA